MAIRSANPGGSTAASPFPAAAPATPAPAIPAAPAASVALIPVRLPSGQIVSVSSQQEVQALQAFALQCPIDLSRPAPPTNTSSTSSSSTAELLDIATDGFTAVSGFLTGSKYSRLLQDLQIARNNLTLAQNALAQKATSNPDLVNPMLDAFDAISDYIDAGVSLLNAQITAVDMMAGGATAKVVGKFIGGEGGIANMLGGGGMGTALALGGAGLGLSLLMSNNSSNASVPPARRIR